MRDSEFHNAIQILVADQPPRVWSLIVTVFGDLAQEHGASLSGATLTKILAPIGVRPEAMRVALHRLRNDGWIETSKRGREALHSLSAFGRQQSAKASTRIYASSVECEEEWQIVCLPPNARKEPEDAASTQNISVAPNVFLANAAPDSLAKDALILKGDLGEVPEWVSGLIVPPAVLHGFKDLTAALTELGLNDQTVSQFSHHQRATLRAIIVHRWRRLILKVPHVPDVLFGTAFEGHICRTQVMENLKLLERPTLSALM